MIRLSTAQVVLLHDLLIQETGGLNGLRDIGLLESALSAPFAAFGGISAYPTIESKAARLAFGLVKNHPFADGNKRIGVLAMMTFLALNGVELSCTDDELITLGLALAEGSITDKEVLDWIVERE